MLPTALIPLPDHPYYLWQTVVHWAHMRAQDWPAHYLVYTGRAGPSDRLRQIMDTSGGEGARFTVWNDWRHQSRTGYNPAMKPGLVGQWLTAHPEQVGEPLLLTDPDALPLPRFRQAITGEGLAPTTDRWWGTDTDAYTGPAYLKSKGEDLWQSLCALAGVDPDQAAEHDGAGSQWLFTGLPGKVWLEIADLAEDAHHILTRHPSDVQVWCAEMYVTQLVLAREGISPQAAPAMRMVWAGDDAGSLDGAGWFHDAGVTAPGEGHFYKGQWRNRAPFFVEDHGVTEQSASILYVEAIRLAEQLWPDLCRRLQNG